MGILPPCPQTSFPRAGVVLCDPLLRGELGRAGSSAPLLSPCKPRVNARGELTGLTPCAGGGRGVITHPVLRPACPHLTHPRRQN